MTKIAFVFPGQGSQSVGMGKEIADLYPEAQEVFQEADKILGFPLSALCFEGPEEDLRLTVNTQPALFTTSVACLRVLEQRGISPAVVAGHSIGEYAALVAAGALSFADGLQLVRKRGELMQEASTKYPGSMAAIIGLKTDQVRAVCDKASEKGIVDVANFNSPGQVVISGETAAVEAASVLAKEAGAKRAMLLNVSGGFHSRLMQPTVEKLAAELDKLPINGAIVPIVANVTAGYETKASEIKDNLAKQIAGSVRWDESITLMTNDGVDTFVEVGSGKVLAGLIKRTVDGVEIRSVGDAASMQAFLETV